MFISHYNCHGIKLVRPLSTVDNTRGYACVYNPTVDSGLTITTCCGLVSDAARPRSPQQVGNKVRD